MNIYIWKDIPVDYLCFTAEQANSTVQLTQTGTPTAVSLETSTDGSTWSSYTIGNTITLSNIGDKVYFRNTSETTTGFSIDYSNCYQFVMNGSISGSGDVNTLINKNSTTTLTSVGCFRNLFSGCSSLIKAPNLTATTLTERCYSNMFYGCNGLTEVRVPPVTELGIGCYSTMFKGCSNLVKLPYLPAVVLKDNCYDNMFWNCSKIKLSTTQTGEYQTPYRIPTTGTGSAGTNSLRYMFVNTGGTFADTPTINTTYYTSNTVV